MNVDAARVVPMGLVVGVIAYCVWPYVFLPSHQLEPPPKSKGPELSAAMLTVAESPVPKRDPFHRADEVAAFLAVQGKGGAAALAGKSRSGAAAKAKGAAGKDNAKVIAVNPLGGLCLEATSISDRQRLAVINGRVYGPHDTVHSPLAGRPAYVVADVLPDRVLLKSNTATLELTYSDKPKAAAAGKDPSYKGSSDKETSRQTKSAHTGLNKPKKKSSR